MQYIETAAAKINLFLHICGRRSDGFHELESLVCFGVDACDRISLKFGDPTALPPMISMSGPFASNITGPNLVATALERLVVRISKPEQRKLKIRALDIEKNLPVAAGIGGGSGDAAAVLRAVKLCHRELADQIDWLALATELGADVPVCLGAEASWMTGIGERVTPAGPLPELAVVLVNPQVSVPDNKTAQVFKNLNAKKIAEEKVRRDIPNVELDFSSARGLIEGLTHLRNDLEEPVCHLMPSVNEVFSALKQIPDCKLVRLSGAGPTVFGLFENMYAANIATKQIKNAHRDWWVVPTRVY
ncbi:MAG: 4-(cytidine 5'-diphospho)-2-C-methyl-D-erythritol kinase [Hyphomicrobiaceae bacterium]